MSVSRLILGTAGLGGLPYGRNKRVASIDESYHVIRHALDRGITMIDTAPAYGFAENVIGSVCRSCRFSPTVFTKTTGDRAMAIESIRLLQPIHPIFQYHNWEDQYVPGWVHGVTMYPDEFHRNPYLATLESVDHWQIPWNILSQLRFKPKSGDVYGRSVFLQGVLAGDPPPIGLKQSVDMAKTLASVYGVDLPTFALRAALENSELSAVVIGPTSIDELDKCIDIAALLPLNIGSELGILNLGFTELTDPRKWAA